MVFYLDSRTGTPYWLLPLPKMMLWMSMCQALCRCQGMAPVQLPLHGLDPFPGNPPSQHRSPSPLSWFSWFGSSKEVRWCRLIEAKPQVPTAWRVQAKEQAWQPGGLRIVRCLGQVVLILSCPVLDQIWMVSVG